MIIARGGASRELTLRRSQERSSQNQGAGYACAAAERMGMVMGLAASVAASMWQRPSKIAPGSMMRQGVWISPVTMALV